MSDFENYVLSVAETTPGDVTVIGMHNETEGLKDFPRTFSEMAGKENASTAITRQAFLAVAETLRKINPQSVFLHIPHSEAGAIGVTAIMGMDTGEQRLISEMMLWMGNAPALPLAKRYARESSNFYSTQDGVTQFFGLFHRRHPVAFCHYGLVGGMLPLENLRGLCGSKLPYNRDDYNIEYFPCTSKWSERSGYIFDHAFLGSTLLNQRIEETKEINKNYGFYRANTR